MPVSTTKVKPLTSGAFTNVTLDGLSRTDRTDTTIAALATAQLHSAVQAVSEWHNAAGTGDHATAARKRANAAGIDLQEV